MPLQFCIICVLIAAVCIPIQVLELGEEIGWREYLLPKQIAVYGARKGTLLNGLYWGIAHLPLIYFGFNYSSDNAGAPWSNMLMMMLVCVTIGIICSYVMVRSDNVMYSAIIHGVVNVIGEIPVFVSVSGKNGLLGPNPTGLILSFHRFLRIIPFHLYHQHQRNHIPTLFSGARQFVLLSDRKGVPL